MCNVEYLYGLLVVVQKVAGVGEGQVAVAGAMLFQQRLDVVNLFNDCLID
jgi:hypothetical protein